MLLEIDHLTKRYGATLALNDLSLRLSEGKVMGLLGPNGSGKTTLIKVLLGLLRQYSGEVRFLSRPIDDDSKAHIAYLPDRNHLPLNWSIEYACSFFADFFADFSTHKAHALCDILKLSKTAKIKQLSKGNKEKLALLLTLSREAKLYIFDEPIAGVDPVARDLVFDLILNNYAQGSSVLIATHLIYDVQKILDEAIFLSNGSVLAHKSVEEFTAGGLNLEEAFKEAFASSSLGGAAFARAESRVESSVESGAQNLAQNPQNLQTAQNTLDSENPTNTQNPQNPQTKQGGVI
ncbi:hypothetical protein BKN38_07675 [Helicobacter sp. CLO-3]|uniref:ABC transporter ATP-binding protein n=1 Tax=unclassified Helicobacter TaxID=2593540 RepID=UPI0008053692|nr:MULTISPECIES: ABC transporter ATP-binding protein [unclassified Helicobacter]OBV29344.1 hypothetical protein BA723_05950 [Helicobacter sp. CLO-3]OHU82126.1 hypothetical protein BKN38_07675 [Helicobacter sp. CLO-3]